jgi:hypothetical protein
VCVIVSRRQTELSMVEERRKVERMCVCVLQGEGQNGTNVKKVCYEQTDRTE